MNAEVAGVTRFVITHIDKTTNLRTLSSAAQGRYTFATKDEAETRLEAITRNNSKSTLDSVYGENPRFEVRECECWPGHFDPKGIYFDDPQDDPAYKRYLAEFPLNDPRD